MTIGVRPEHLVPEPARAGGIEATVQLAERLGDQTLLEVRTRTGATLIAKAEPGTSLSVGDGVSLGFSEDDVHLFDAAGAAFGQD